MSARDIFAVLSIVVIVAVVAAVYAREFMRQRRHAARVARETAARLHGRLGRTRGRWRIDAVYEGRPVIVLLGRAFVPRSDIDNGPDIVTALEIETPCATEAALSVHSNAGGAASYVRAQWAKARGTQLVTGASEFDRRFVVQGNATADGAILDEAMRGRMLATPLAARELPMAARVENGSASIRAVFEVFDQDKNPLPEAKVVAETLSYVTLACGLAANAEQRRPAVAVRSGA